VPGPEGWALSPSPLGAEGGARGAEAALVPGGADACCTLPSQPLPDNSTLLMNQSTLKQLPETARQRQLHAFKICKKFQVGAGPRHGTAARCDLVGSGCPAVNLLPVTGAALRGRGWHRVALGDVV